MTLKIDDENWVREHYANSTKVVFTYPTVGEKKAIRNALWRLDSLDHETTLLGIGVLLMMLSGEGPQSELICSWGSREGDHIDLARNVYVTEFYLPDDAANPIDADYFHEVKSQRLEIPFSAEVSKALRNSEKFGRCDSFELGELLPLSIEHLWARLYKLIPDYLMKNRKGLSFFHAWHAVDISERCDKDMAFALTQFKHFSSNHATYYPTYSKERVIQIMCDVQEAMFGLPIERPEYVDGYVGSHVYLKDWVLIYWLNSFYHEFPAEQPWRSYDKAKLERYRNKYVYVVWIALASNFSLRYCSGRVVNPLLNEELGELVKILDKNVNKEHPERYLPSTSITRAIVRHFREVDQVIKRRFSFPQKEHELNLIDLENRSLEPISNQHVNDELFAGINAPINAIRHFMDSKMKERGVGPWVQTLMGHRPDSVSLPNVDILFSPAGGEMAKEIEAIQSEIIGLLPPNMRSFPTDSDKIRYQKLLTKGLSELSAIWATTKSEDVLKSLSKHGASLKKQGSFNCLVNDNGFLDFASDEEVAFIRSRSTEELAKMAKFALKERNKAKFVSIGDNEHFRHHIEHYSKACNYLSNKCLASLFQPTSNNSIRRIYSPLKWNAMSPERSGIRVKKLISRLKHRKNSPIKLLRRHLTEEFCLKDHDSLDIDTLLNLIQSGFDNAEITVYRFMLKKMRERETRPRRRSVAASTWSTECSKVYLRFLKVMGQFSEVSHLSLEEIRGYRNSLYEMINTSLKQETIGSMDYIINGLFSSFGSEPFKFYSSGKVSRKPTEKHLIWPFEYLQVLNTIAVSDLLLEEKIISRAAVVLMYKAGVRPHELNLIMQTDILDSLRVVSNPKSRTKSEAGNRVIHYQVTLTGDDKAILNELCKIPAKHVGDCMFNKLDLPWISHILKSVTSNSDVSPYCLRYSFANFHYLLIMRVNLPILSDYFGCKNLACKYEELTALWTIKGYEKEAILKALSRTMGHANIATTMNSYICTVPLVRLYYRLNRAFLSNRKIAKLLAIPPTTYAFNKRKNEKTMGLSIGTHYVSDINTRPLLVEVKLNDSSSAMDVSLNAKIVALQCLLNGKESNARVAVIKEARLYGLTVKSLAIALKQDTTYQMSVLLHELSTEARQQVYEEWLSKCSSNAQLASRLSSKGFIRLRDVLSLDYRLKERKYVFRGKRVGLNKNIAAALLVVHSKVALH